MRELKRLKKHPSRISRRDIPVSEPAEAIAEPKATNSSAASSPDGPDSDVSRSGPLRTAKTGKRSFPVKTVFLSPLAVLLFVSAGYLAYRIFSGPQVPLLVQASSSQITVAPEMESFPDISPDGKHVVFTKTSDGQSDIFFQRARAGNALNLTAHSPRNDWQPASSPEGEQIAFRSEREGGGIFIMVATGESVRRVTDFGYNPVWSPDRKSLLFATELVENPYGRGTISAL